jgi:VWFA-related protein
MAVNLAAQISHFSDLRAIAVTVQDAAGQPVTDLSLKNFAVTEDGKPQRVVVCAYQDFTQFPPGPPTAPAAVTLQPERPGSLLYNDRRLLVFYFDSTDMPAAERASAQAAALEFVETRMAPQDLVAVLALRGEGLAILSDFTDDRTALAAVLQHLSDDTLPVPPCESTGAAFCFEPPPPETARFQALDSAMRMLAALSERKALVYFSSGIGRRQGSNGAFPMAIAADAMRYRISINPIETSRTAGADDASGDFPGLARDTGGIAALDGADLTGAIARVEEANVSYYLLLYWVPSDATLGNRAYNADVSLAGARPGWNLSYRRGALYTPWRDGRERDTETVLNAALYTNDPPIRQDLYATVGPARPVEGLLSVPVNVEVPGPSLALLHYAGNTAPFPFQVAIAVTDRDGKTVAYQRDTVTAPADTFSVPIPRLPSIEYRTSFRLDPGDYQLRVAILTPIPFPGTYRASFSVEAASHR